jgi:hypothetical protein
MPRLKISIKKCLFDDLSIRTGAKSRSNIYVIFLFLCTVFIACEESQFIEIKTDYHKQLVCTGFAGNDGKTMIYLQITDPILKSGAHPSIIEANILIYVNREAEGVISTGNNYYEIPQNKSFTEGDSLFIHIDTPQFGHSYSSKVIMPKTIPIDSASISTLTGGLSQVRIYFNDPPGRNYYGIKKIWITEAGIVPGDYLLVSPGGVFSDELAAEGQMIVKERIYHSYSIDGNIYPLQKVMIILYHLSEPAYRFFSSIYESEGGLGDLFEEPTIIYSNIRNGLGVFATYATDTLMIDINH